MTVESIGVAGSGRVAGALAIALGAAGVPLSVVAARSGQARAGIARQIGAADSALHELPRYASIALLAVSDDAIAAVAQELAESGGPPLRVALHTSGGAGPDALDALRQQGTAIGVLHPLQTIPSAEAGARSLAGSTFAYAGDPAAEAVARKLIEALEGTALRIDPPRWQYYHAAAVMVSNYQAALVEAALELMEGAGVDRPAALAALRPLIEQSTCNILKSGPRAALTGPIRRGDLGTVVRHIQAIRNAPAGVRELYAAAGLQTIALAERAGLPAGEAREIAKALAGAAGSERVR